MLKECQELPVCNASRQISIQPDLHEVHVQRCTFHMYSTRMLTILMRSFRQLLSLLLM